MAGLVEQRRTRRTKASDLIYLIVGGPVAYAFFGERLGVIFVVAVWGMVFMIWLMFFMPTDCDYDLGTWGCGRKVYGKLRGCGQPDRLKRDAVWAGGAADSQPWNALSPEVKQARGAGWVRWCRRFCGRLSPYGGKKFSYERFFSGVYGLTTWFFTAVSAVAAVVGLRVPK